MDVKTGVVIGTGMRGVGVKHAGVRIAFGVVSVGKSRPAFGADRIES
jgi:hypothetical protein